MASSEPPEGGKMDGSLYPALQNTDFFKSLVENGSDAIVSINENSTILYANSSVKRIFGYTPEEMIGEDLTMIMPERFHQEHFEGITRYIESGERGLDWNNIELPAVNKEGELVDLSITFEEHTYEGERIFSGIMRDISDRKTHEENLVRLQEMSQTLMQVQDKTRIAEEVVAAAEETLEFPIVSMFFYDESTDGLRAVAHSDAVHDVLDEVPVLDEGSLAWEAYQQGESRQYIAEETEKTSVLRPSGPIASEYIFPLDEQGCLIVSTTAKRNIDDRRHTLAQILAANAESALKRASREAEREQQRERLERFASIVSHDLRDPINTARATLAVARDGDEAALEELDSLFDRMDDLIEDVLLLAKEGKAIGDTEPVGLREVVTEAWETVETENAFLEIGELSSVSADEERLRVLFQNLFRNAVNHGGPSVTVRVGALEADTGFYIEDDGPGFADVDTEQIFEYGYTTEKDNTGFGLSIVSEIVDAHGWSIEAVSGENRGARFEITT